MTLLHIFIEFSMMMKMDDEKKTSEFWEVGELCTCLHIIQKLFPKNVHFYAKMCTTIDKFNARTICSKAKGLLDN